MQIYLIGPSGSGKDTQAKILAGKYHLTWISGGDLLRARAKIDDEEGRYIKMHIDNGDLVDWSHLMPIMKDRLTKVPKDYIWTGFPRLYEQTFELDELLKDNFPSLDLVINLSLSDEHSRKRIEYHKSTEEKIREDDTKDELIQKRIDWYKNSIDRIKEYYLKTNRFVEIDAQHDIPTIAKNISEIIDAHFGL